MSKQTALQQLIDELSVEMHTIEIEIRDNPNCDAEKQSYIHNAFYTALKLAIAKLPTEREQIIYAHAVGFRKGIEWEQASIFTKGELNKVNTGEDYFTTTFPTSNKF